MKNELNKLLENRIYNHEECVSKIEGLADELAIGFAEWCSSIDIKDTRFKINTTSKQILEMYKKEKGF